MYYNTTNLSGEELKEAVIKAKTQQEAIMLIFQNSQKPFTPSMIWGMTSRAGHQWVLTSVRRCMTDLTTDGKLEKLPHQKIGMYGAKEFYWQLKSQL